MNNKLPIFGKTCEEVNNCFFDYYSIGHFIMGYIAYIISTIVWAFLPFDFDIQDISLLSTVIVGMLWELIENYLLVDTSLKHERRRDSLGNSLTDTFIVFGGGIVCRILAEMEVIVFLIASLWILIITIIVFDICKRLTHNNRGK